MTKPQINVMMTCVNSQVAPSIIKLIRNHPEYDIEVIGCDASPVAQILGRHFCDHVYSIPQGSAPNYIPQVMELVTKHKIQLIFPGSDEECLPLSQHRNELQQHGGEVACSSYDVIKMVSNKYQIMTQLKEAGIHSAEVYIPQTLNELESIAKLLGYPEKQIVIKPQVGRGSRGFRIIDANYDKYEAFCGRGVANITLEDLKNIFKNHEKKIADYLIMELYPGDKYSADILVSHGEIISMVIRNNGPVVKINPPTQNAGIVFDEDVRDYAKRVVKLMKFDYFIQVEIGRDIQGNLGLIEINPRLDATLPITTGLGLNFVHEMITYAITGQMRKGIPDYHNYPKQLRFRRYWMHLFDEIPKEA